MGKKPQWNERDKGNGGKSTKGERREEEKEPKRMRKKGKVER